MAGGPYTRAEVEALAAALFPDEDRAALLATLDEYGARSYERERERVQLAALRLSGGDLGRLLELLAAAKVDYRDVLLWAEYRGGVAP